MQLKGELGGGVFFVSKRKPSDTHLKNTWINKKFNGVIQRSSSFARWWQATFTHQVSAEKSTGLVNVDWHDTSDAQHSLDFVLFHDLPNVRPADVDILFIINKKKRNALCNYCVCFVVWQISSFLTVPSIRGDVTTNNNQQHTIIKKTQKTTATNKHTHTTTVPRSQLNSSRTTVCSTLWDWQKKKTFFFSRR